MAAELQTDATGALEDLRRGGDPEPGGSSCRYEAQTGARVRVPPSFSAVRSKVDGSFETFLSADVDDFLSATFVNGNGDSDTTLDNSISAPLTAANGVLYVQTTTHLYAIQKAP